jgi:low temperature requirement protein LtrA
MRQRCCERRAWCLRIVLRSLRLQSRRVLSQYGTSLTLRQGPGCPVSDVQLFPDLDLPDGPSEEDTCMRLFVDARPVPAEESHRVTPFEIFFDLVFVFALIQVISFMAKPPTPLILFQGLVVVLLLSFSFDAFTWVGNQVRLDVGLVRAGMFVVMAVIFVAALVIPDAWRPGKQNTGAALALALAYIVVRTLHTALYYYGSAGNRRLRVQILLFAIPAAVASIPLILGAVLGGTAQTALWAVALLVFEAAGGRVAVVYGGFALRSPGYFAERHGLVLIIALGLSLIAVGAGTGTAVTRWPVLIGALLSLTAAACLWWLYFENAASPASQALARRHRERRASTAADAYSRTHTLLIAGIVYLALGLNRVLTHVADNEPGTPPGAPLHWPSIIALYGGVVLYLTGRALFLRLTVGHTPPAQIIAAGATLALLTAVLVTLVGYERLTWEPATARASAVPGPFGAQPRQTGPPAAGGGTPLSRLLHARPVPTQETHRATSFEFFFDLVLVFALIRIDSFMAQPPTPLILAQGLILLFLLWWAFESYQWLGNQARADVGLIRAGMFVAMAAIFVAALLIPDAWRPGSRAVDARLTLAVAFVVLRALHLALFYYLSASDRRLRVQVLLFAIPTVLAWIPLVLGALLGGTAQILLWTAAFLVDAVGALTASVYGGWRLRSPSHYAERHGLVLIIALGESLISVGAGAGSAVTRWPVLLAALLAFTAAVCLWWLYFENAASPAGRALARMSNERRVTAANNAYAVGHFLLITGVIYLALGIEQVVAQVAHNPPGQPAGVPLDWTTTAALYGGVVLYLTGRALFLHFTVGHTPQAQIIAAGVTIALLPAARHLPALAALGLLTAVLLALAGYERRFTWEPAAAAR